MVIITFKRLVSDILPNTTKDLFNICQTIHFGLYKYLLILSNFIIMNSLRNRVQLIGNPGADPEIKNLENGGKMAKFSLATNESFKNAMGERIEDTNWHTIIAWGKVAELVEKYVHKGKEVGVEGKLISRNYESTNGEKKYVTEVILKDLLLLAKKD